MALIRHAQAEQIARDAIVLDLGDVRTQAEIIVRQARVHADAIVREAKAERERLIAGATEQGRAAGHGEGYARGEAKGREEGRAAALKERREELAKIEGAWNGALALFAQRREDILSDAQESVLRLACRIAERVTRRVVETDPGVVIGQVRDAIAMVAGPSILNVLVCPEDEALARESLPAIMAALGGSSHAEVRADPGVTRGSCVVRTVAGEIDASIESQLERIASSIVPGAAMGAVGPGVGGPEREPSP